MPAAHDARPTVDERDGDAPHLPRPPDFRARYFRAEAPDEAAPPPTARIAGAIWQAAESASPYRRYLPKMLPQRERFHHRFATLYHILAATPASLRLHGFRDYGLDYAHIA